MTDYGTAKEYTAISLQHMLDTTELSHLSLPERNALVESIARSFPAGNIPSMVAAGLIRTPGKVVSETDNRRNLTLLMQGMQTFLDKAVFNTFFVGPAAVLSAYQMILKLAGKDPEQSFPDGTWQFYVEFGLREDSGRHACETIGFSAAVEREHLRLDSAEELACWLAASAWLLDRYDALLENEWTERFRLRQYAQITANDQLGAEWIKCRPYSVPASSTDDYTIYRKAQFTDFYNRALTTLDRRIRHRVEAAWDAPAALNERSTELTAYQRQLAIRATLTPGEYSDARIPLSAAQLNIGVIVDGRYYLVRALSGVVPLSAVEARPISNALLRHKPESPVAALDKMLTTAHRHNQPALRRLIDDTARTDFEALRTAPILINWDRADASAPLVKIREGRRGIGDHPLTIFRTAESSVFDLSHIFFDGPWGIAVAEILTSQATRFARQMSALPRQDHAAVVVRPLTLSASPKLATAARAAHLLPEVSAETTIAQLEPIQRIRHFLQQRNERLKLTVNDILILYRGLFGQFYKPAPEIVAALIALEISPDEKERQAASIVRASIEAAQQLNPSLLIPMDATNVNPRERIYPTTFRNPLTNILSLHRKALDALYDVNHTPRIRRPFAWSAFENTRTEYLSTFIAFGTLMAQYKDMTLSGESVSTSTIKLLGGLPNSVRRMLDSVPDHFDAVNDVVKGQEVFSNVGRVTAESSLRRFNTAKDDNEKKTLAWGVMTDATGVLHISLRDFRPHVAVLIKLKHGDLAQKITSDYVESYARNLNQFVAEVVRLILMRRNPTQQYPPEQ